MHAVVWCTQIAYTERGVGDAPMTVVETAEFVKRAKGLMTDSERETLVVFVERLVPALVAGYPKKEGIGKKWLQRRPGDRRRRRGRCER